MALGALALLAAGCAPPGGEDTTSPLAEGEDQVLAESPAPIRPAIVLGTRDPASVLAGAGLVFGTAGGAAVLSVQGYETDPLVQQAVVRDVYAADTGEPVGSVVVLTLAPGVFTSTAAVDGYVRGLASGAAESVGGAQEIALGGVDGFFASTESQAFVTFRLDDVVALVSAPTGGGAQTLAATIAQGALSGAGGAVSTVTPFAEVPASSAFVDLEGFEFDLFPGDDEKGDLAYEPQPAPLLDGLLGLPEARLVVIGNEIRGAAWVLPAARASYASAEELVEPMRLLAAERSGGEVTEEVVAGRTVFAGDAGASVRVAVDENLVLVVDGIDPVNADAILAEWLGSLGTT